jgi:DHA2 family multidrug resistance protein
MRNMGSSVGTSLVTTLIARRSQFHQEILANYARADSANFQNTIGGLSQYFAHSGLSPYDANARAYASVYQNVQLQAGTLAYIDTFMVLAVGAGIMFFLSFLLKKNDPGGGGGAEAVG